MDREFTFRLILALGLAVVFPFALYFRLKSQVSGERLDRMQEGWFILLSLRPVALLRMAGLIVYLIRPESMAWSSIRLPPGVRWSGVGFGVAAAILLLWTMRALGGNLTDTVVTRRRHSLVTSGPYRWVQHPFYVAAALAMTADSLVAANWFLAGTGVVTAMLLVKRTAREEERLMKRFGSPYRQYRLATGRFFPRFGFPR